MKCKLVVKENYDESDWQKCYISQYSLFPPYSSVEWHVDKEQNKLQELLIKIYSVIP
jgi:hypothetical protein